MIIAIREKLTELNIEKTGFLNWSDCEAISFLSKKMLFFGLQARF